MNGGRFDGLSDDEVEKLISNSMLPRLQWIEVDDADRPLESDYCIVAYMLVTGDVMSHLAVYENGQWWTWLKHTWLRSVTHWLKVTPR